MKQLSIYLENILVAASMIEIPRLYCELWVCETVIDTTFSFILDTTEIPVRFGCK